jgi:hypothetical protein
MGRDGSRRQHRHHSRRRSHHQHQLRPRDRNHHERSIPHWRWLRSAHARTTSTAACSSPKSRPWPRPRSRSSPSPSTRCRQCHLIRIHTVMLVLQGHVVFRGSKVPDFVPMASILEKDDVLNFHLANRMFAEAKATWPLLRMSPTRAKLDIGRAFACKAA